MRDFKCGIVMDVPNAIGGAELSMQKMVEDIPDLFEPIMISPFNFEQVEECDIYVVGNCTMFPPQLIDVLQGKPVVKYVMDRWVHGSWRLRTWLLENAKLVLVSPDLLKKSPWVYNDYDLVPSPVDIGLFSRAKIDREVNGGKNDKAIWLGRMHHNKGVHNAIRYAEEKNIELHMFGHGDVGLAGKRYMGSLEPEEVPEVLAMYKTFIFLPNEFDACPRTIIEAWAAGCQLVLNDRIGSSYWINNENNVHDLYLATENFWDIVVKTM